MKQQATTVRQALPAGDYGVLGADGSLLASVERKASADLIAIWAPPWRSSAEIVARRLPWRGLIGQ